ncbi:glycoside hydrolase domain-containing protein [Sphingobacterium sp. SYP-B4668]|uniref:glycoside hydrolase domain-containing protein n=1 Tax=Sphingobacterium sp. SYP-B4668 TaxID=2996035 RepID=UPI0022DD1AEC|nr:glycoside hydrolase domain-containing protein [Sphingobacterium sp. SYP-B4668]
MKKIGILLIMLCTTLDVVHGQQGKDTRQTSYDGESQYAAFSPDGIPFVVSEKPWDVDSLGNHRAVVRIDGVGGQEAVYVKLLWRRPDLNPAHKAIVIRKKGSIKEVKQLYVMNISAEQGELIFKPEEGDGEYEIYYLPYKFRKGWDDARYGKPWNDYLVAQEGKDKDWGLRQLQNLAQMPRAKVLRFESRSKFDAFTPMGLIGTQREQDSIYHQHKDKAILFTEDRAFPIRLTRQLPARWSQQAAHSEFKGEAMKNEYYTWQIGVWAPTDSLTIEKIEISDLQGQGRIIPKAQSTCFNKEGISWKGTPISFDIGIPANRIQALWLGTQIPEDCPAGAYTGKVKIFFKGMAAPKVVDLKIDVQDGVLKDKGDGDLWRHARLRWLNSTIGQEDEVVHPYTGLSLQGNTIRTDSKEVRLGKNGLPLEVDINNRAVFAKPVRFLIEDEQGKIWTYKATNFQVKQNEKGVVTWESSEQLADMTIRCVGKMEFDGHMQYDLSIVAKTAKKIKNVSMLHTYPAATSRYFMGLGHTGGKIPKDWEWKWNGPYDSYWLGDYNVGAHVEYLGAAYNGPLLKDYKALPAAAWHNNGKGRVTLRTANNGEVELSSETGDFVLTDSARHFEFAILLTPVRPLDTKLQFSQRYYHSDTKGFKAAAKEGANIANIHHSQNLNPVINYPFVMQDSLIDYIQEMHRDSLRVKLYYTVRELSNYVTEVYALHSLDNEIFAPGPGYGLPWHMEHLIDNYKAAWYTELPGQHSDAALVLSGFSRWINYYLEGLRWMFENYKIDGIYMDDVSFDRRVMKRMRRIIDEYRPGALIDLHSNTGYSIGAANQYTDFFPYVDRLWFGESFKYNKMDPDEWFVTFSGIPFGVMSEMLQDGGNPYLGMVYGTTGRHSYGDKSPAPIWDLWKSFGIEEAKMVGYWDKDSPIQTGNEAVKATTFQKDGKMMLVLGNFSAAEQTVKLAIDWKKIKGIKGGELADQPFIKDFQPHRQVELKSTIKIAGKQSIILIVN